MSNVKEYTKEYLEKNVKPLLKVGASIKIGKHYTAEVGGFKSGEVITLIEGHFDFDNGLYTVGQTAPSVWNEDAKEFDSIFHLFGNDLENFYDCEVLTPPPMTNSQLPAEVQERIKADAAKTYPLTNGNDLETGKRMGYIEGAMAEAGHISPMADVLDQIAQAPTPANEREMLSWIDTARNLCETTLQQWKEGKEPVKDPCLNCGKELSRDRHGCCRECGAYGI